MNTETPTTTSAKNPAFLRPRNRRQVSEDDGTLSVNNVNSLNPSRFGVAGSSSSSSRAVSPIPSRHPSRPVQPIDNTKQRAQRFQNNARASPGVGSQGSYSSPSTVAASLWETSWSSIQGIATNLLSGDNFGSTSRDQSATRQRRRPLEATISTKSNGPAHWGPSGNAEKQLGRGTKEDRLAQVQAKKRETLLTANGFLNPDATGRYKRRDSEDRNTSSAAPNENDDRDALVYIHKVRSSDTLAGVMIKYNCQPNAFRKANRLWPNDSIQVKKIVVLPVDACGVRGRKVLGPGSTLRSESSQDSMRTPTNTHHPWSSSANSSDTKETPLSSIPTSPSVSASSPEELPWKHDSWVMIDKFADPVQIARLSRSNLAYFPPRRKKSISFSDLDNPSASPELSRDRSQGRSPRRKDSRSSSGSHFIHQLQGPGGVGTMGREVRNPGPAPDGLNKLFPKVAPRTSFESEASTASTGLENVGGAIEGWVRKLATKAAAGVQSPARGRGGTSGIGDLIELTNAFELGEEDENDDDDSDTIGKNRNAPKLKYAVRTWQEDQERMLREHFPPRGRVFEESTARRKGG